MPVRLARKLRDRQTFEKFGRALSQAYEASTGAVTAAVRPMITFHFFLRTAPSAIGRACRLRIQRRAVHACSMRSQAYLVASIALASADAVRLADLSRCRLDSTQGQHIVPRAGSERCCSETPSDVRFVFASRGRVHLAKPCVAPISRSQHKLHAGSNSIVTSQLRC